MEGKTAEIDEDYFGLGDTMELPGIGKLKFNYEPVGRPPLHPNCRCITESLVNPAYQV
jgi:hypothetical protein